MWPTVERNVALPYSQCVRESSRRDADDVSLLVCSMILHYNVNGENNNM